VRLFVALEIPSAVRENLATLIGELRAADASSSKNKARWVRPENLHVTMKFIGHVEAGKLDPIRAALGDVRSEQPVDLTLARFDPPGLSEKLRAATREDYSREFGTLHTGEFHLIESKTRPTGAEYMRLSSFRFAKAEA
jgi:2'-5' RNA ligase